MRPDRVGQGQVGAAGQLHHAGVARVRDVPLLVDVQKRQPPLQRRVLVAPTGDEQIGTGDIGITLNALGTVTSLATVTVRSQISGYLMKIDFKEGDEVKKGDVIAEIDSRPYEASLAQAKGQLARDEALLKGAQVDLQRYQGLAAQNAVPHQTLDTQVALVAQDQGTVEADRAAVQSAEVNLNYTRILSPIDGRVGLRQVDQGNYVTPGDTNGLVVITQLTPISVLFTVPEDNLQAIAKRLKAGAVLPVTALDRDDEPLGPPEPVEEPREVRLPVRGIARAGRVVEQGPHRDRGLHPQFGLGRWCLPVRGSAC